MILTEEKYLLTQLLTHNRINIYELYTATSFSTGQIVRMLLKYQRKGYLIMIGKTVYRTPIGKIKLKKIRLTELNEVERYWATVPEGFKKDRVAINEPIQKIRVPR